MAYLLLWLALPLLLLPWSVPTGRVGAAASRLMMGGLGLAALFQGAGTLDPLDLRTIAEQSPRDALFVAATAGAMLTGACHFFWPTGRAAWRLLPSLPLFAGLLFIGLGWPLPMLVGMVVGTIPKLAARWPSRGWSDTAGWLGAGPAQDVDTRSLVLGAIVVVSAPVGPAVFSLSALAVLSWHERARWRASGESTPLPALETAATALLAGWSWFSLTIAGSIVASLPAIARDAPISPAAAGGLALLAVGWAALIAAPWPIDRFANPVVQLPAVAVVLHFAGAEVARDGMTHWQPAITAVLVVSALAGAWRGRWRGAAAAIVLLGATRAEAISAAGAIILAVVLCIRSTSISPRTRTVIAAVSVAMVLAGALRDQVVLSLVLGFGVASAARRSDPVVAPS